MQIAAPLAVDPAEVLDRVEARKLDRSQQLALIAAREAWADAGSPRGRPRAPRRRHRLRHRRRHHACSTPTTSCSDAGPVAHLAAHRPDAHAQRPGRRASASSSARRPASTRPCQRLRLRRRGHRLRPRDDPQRPRRRRHRRRHRGRASTRSRSPASPRCARCRPATTSPSARRRPYDKGRDGFVLGEGAGIARPRVRGARRRPRRHGLRRGRRRRASPPTATTSRSPTPRAAAPPARSARRSRTPASPRADIVHVNAHATSTPQGDVAEAIAIRGALGAATDHVAVTGTKSMTGHLLGAAGAIESIATILALHHRLAPADDQPRGPRRRGRPRRRRRQPARAARRRHRRAQQLVRLRRPQRRPRLPEHLMTAVGRLRRPRSPTSTRAHPLVRLDGVPRRRLARADHRRRRQRHARRRRHRARHRTSSSFCSDATVQGGAMGIGGCKVDRRRRTSARSPTASRSSACGTPAARACARASRACTPSAWCSRS